MKRKLSILAIGLLACSMQALPETPSSAPAATPGTAPPEIIRFHTKPAPATPGPRDGKGLPPARLCNLGVDCLAMDSHPFEMCQLSGKSCGDKLAEVLQVQKPRIVMKPAPALTGSRP